MNKKIIVIVISIMLLLSACSKKESKKISKENQSKELNILIPCYGKMKDATIIYGLDVEDEDFYRETGIRVNYIKSGENTEEDFFNKLAMKMHTKPDFDIIYTKTNRGENRNIKTILDESGQMLDLSKNLKNYKNIPEGIREKNFAYVLANRNYGYFKKEDLEKCKVDDLQSYIDKYGDRELCYEYNKEPIALDLEYIAKNEDINIKINEQNIKIEVDELESYLQRIKKKIRPEVYGLEDIDGSYKIDKMSYENNKLEFLEKREKKEVKPNKLYEWEDVLWRYKNIMTPDRCRGTIISPLHIVEKENIVGLETEDDKMYGSGYYVLKNAENKRNAINYIDYMLGETVQREVLEDVMEPEAFMKMGHGGCGPIHRDVPKWIEEEKYAIEGQNKEMINSFFKELEDKEWVESVKISEKEKMVKDVFCKEMEYVLLNYLTGKEFTDKELQKIIDEIEFKINIRLGEM